MFIKLIYYYLSVIYLVSVCANGNEKSSLTFVIDSTMSMHIEIDQVKREVYNIFDAVVNSGKSHIENFVLVIFRDPDVELLTVTKDREEFKQKVASIELIGNYDCPEYSMSGTLKALEASLPGSMVVVITDAAANDDYKYEEVRELAQKKGAKLIFLMTRSAASYCPKWDSIDNNKREVYHPLAEATDGEVFDLTKDEIQKILDYVKESVKKRTTNFVSKTFVPGTHLFNFTVDSNMKELVISIKGQEPKFDVYDPEGDLAETEEIVRTSRTAIFKVLEVKTGVYIAEVSSESSTKIDITGEDTMQFQIGFSKQQPTCIEETAPSPLPDERCFMSIKLNAEGLVDLKSVQLTDLDLDVLYESVLEFVDVQNKFYITELFMPPKKTFRVAIHGYDYDSKSSVTRFGLIPLEVQDPNKVVATDRAPKVTLIGQSEIFADYEKPLELKCRVSGYPKPDVTWEDADGLLTTFDTSTVEIPYDYISIFSIDVVTLNNTYKCSARNNLGEDHKTITVKTIRTNYFDVIETPKHTEIKFRESAKVYCKIDADPPATVKWFHNKVPIKNSKYYNISSDKSVLTIKNMHPKMAGKYACRATNNKYSTKPFRFQVSITGIVKPKIDKNTNEIRVREGSTAEINCRILEGTPEPSITWEFKPIHASLVQKISGNNKTLVIENVDISNTGHYRCKASNIAGDDYYYYDLIVEYAPKIKKNPSKNLIVIDEKTAHLPCIVYGEPLPAVKWYYNGQPVTIDSVNFHDDNMKLRFKASIEYTGNYHCEAVNIHGTARSEPIHVEVIVPVSIYPQSFTTTEVDVGEFVQLTCEADGYPTPTVKWIFYNADTEPSGQVLDNTQSTLDIQHIQVNQEGNYTCVASNSGSTDNVTYEVKVNAPPSIVLGMRGTYFRSVDGDVALNIPCKAIGSPKPDIVWTYGGFNIPSESQWYNIGPDGTLTIKDITMEAAGEYTCHASNNHGVDQRVFVVEVLGYPPEPLVEPSIPLSIEEGKTGNVPCDIKRSLVDTIRWYKDKKLIANGELTLTNVTTLDAGLYTCRVSSVHGTKSSYVRINIGTKPKFVRKTENPKKIVFYDGHTVDLDCFAEANPTPEVTWWHNNHQLKHNRMTYNLTMTSNGRGMYFCVVENKFGNAVRSFDIISNECRLNVESDFGGKNPLILLPDYSLPSYDIIDGFARIPSHKRIILLCPDQFEHFPISQLSGMCVRDEIFDIVKDNYSYEHLKCKDEFEPIIYNTEKPCLSKDTQMIHVGYDVKYDFLKVYEVCFDLSKNVPIYAKYYMDKSAADIDLNDTNWFDNDMLELDFEDLYDCDRQTKQISKVLRKDFHRNDSCCFSKRLLVPPRDMPPGMPQIATLSTLNMIPQWSTDSMKNWDKIERHIRKLAKSSDDSLVVYTGTSDNLKMKVHGHGYELGIRLTDDRQKRYQPVPLYLWKVVQNPTKNASIAIIQVNVPDLKNGHQYMKCRDICNEIVWMHSNRWRDVSRGFTYCCNLTDFQTAFQLDGVFESNMDNVLTV